MIFNDFHCDSLMTAYASDYPSLTEMPRCMLDIKRMRVARENAQFFAIFMLPLGASSAFGKEDLDDDDYIDQLIAIFHTSVKENPAIFAPAYDSASYIANQNEGKISGFLTLEDGRSVCGELDKLQMYYDKGIRLITLTWNYENCFGFPNSPDAKEMKKGLKDFGKDAIRYMNELGMMIDVSHLSDGGFYDVAEISRKPFVASHSNCRALSPHPRNLTDDMIRVLANHGGAAGLNFAPAFLSSDITNTTSKVTDMVRHIQHMINVGGEDVPVLGSDLDGITGTLEIGSTDKMPLLFEALEKAGLPYRITEKIATKNMERVIKDILS